jgi:hypothetical protein
MTAEICGPLVGRRFCEPRKHSGLAQTLYNHVDRGRKISTAIV